MALLLLLASPLLLASKLWQAYLLLLANFSSLWVTVVGLPAIVAFLVLLASLLFLSKLLLLAVLQLLAFLLLMAFLLLLASPLILASLFELVVLHNGLCNKIYYQTVGLSDYGYRI
jgi:hypothetical protein